MRRVHAPFYSFFFVFLASLFLPLRLFASDDTMAIYLAQFVYEWTRISLTHNVDKKQRNLTIKTTWYKNRQEYHAEVRKTHSFSR